MAEAQITCADCAMEFAWTVHGGTRPVRCPECRKKRNVTRAVANARANPNRKANVARWNNNNRDKLSAGARYRTYRVTAEQFAEQFAKQGGRCAICGGMEAGGKDWCWDHSHAFHPHDPDGHRGILCRRCNWMLGHARDNEDILAAGIQYLANHRSRLPN